MRKDLLATCFILCRVQISRNPQLGCQGFRTVGGKQICACGQSEGRGRCPLGRPCAYTNQPSPLVNPGTGQVLSNAASRISAPNDWVCLCLALRRKARSHVKTISKPKQTFSSTVLGHMRILVSGTYARDVASIPSFRNSNTNSLMILSNLPPKSLSDLSLPSQAH